MCQNNTGLQWQEGGLITPAYHKYTSKLSFTQKNSTPYNHLTPLSIDRHVHAKRGCVVLCGTHLRQRLLEEERDFLGLCSTKEAKPHYSYTKWPTKIRRQVFPHRKLFARSTLGKVYEGNIAAKQSD